MTYSESLSIIYLFFGLIVLIGILIFDWYSTNVSGVKPNNMKKIKVSNALEIALSSLFFLLYNTDSVIRQMLFLSCSINSIILLVLICNLDRR